MFSQEGSYVNAFIRAACVFGDKGLGPLRFCAEDRFLSITSILRKTLSCCFLQDSPGAPAAPGPKKGGTVDPSLFVSFPEDDVEHKMLMIIEDLLGESLPSAGQMPYMRQLLQKFKTRSAMDFDKQIDEGKFPTLLTQMVGFRAIYHQIYSYLDQAMRLMWAKALWYGGEARGPSQGGPLCRT